MPPAHLTPYGERGLLIEIDAGVEDPAKLVAGWAAAVQSAGLPGVLDIVPAARSVLLHLADAQSAQQLRPMIAGLQPLSDDPRQSGDLVEIPVVYDGPDLDAVAAMVRLSRDQVVALHTGSLWTARFAGFAPGFAYLAGADGRLSVPRRAEPRTRVPGGSVALAAGYSAVYPRSSPGGWQLIGRTDASMWDLTRDPPALVGAGQRVRFVERFR
jgi:KipI family sensor histidine kinase inhibitor